MNDVVAIGIPYLEDRVEELAVDDEQVKRQTEESDKHAAGTRNSTSLDKDEDMQQNKDEGSGAEEDSVLEGAEDFDGWSSDDLKWLNNFAAEGLSRSFCANCVRGEICKTCGNKDGIPYLEEEGDYF